MNTQDLILTISKFISITMTGFFGVLALAKPYRDKDGQLSKSGRIAIKGAIISFIIALLSQSLELQRAHNQAISSQEKTQSDLSHFEQLLHEVQRTSPLTSLKIRITVNNLPVEIINKIKQGISEAESSTSDSVFQDLAIHHEVDDNDGIALIQSEMDKKVIQPFINWIATNHFKKEQSFIAVGADNHLSTLICAGWIRTPEIGLFYDSVSYLPSGILLGDQIDWAPSYRKEILKRKKRERPGINLQLNGDSAVLSIDLTPTSLDDVLLRYASRGALNATFPGDLILLTWATSSVKDSIEADEGPLKLPFDTTKIHESVFGINFFRDTALANSIPPSLHKIRIELIPNDADVLLKSYTFNIWSHGNPIEGSREDEPRGYMRFWHGKSN